MHIDNSDKIDSLQALRTFAFLGIFFSHADFIVSWPGLGVSVFFVLSGFLTYRKNANSTLPYSFRENINFSWRRISKLYLLHIVTMCFAVVLAVAGVIHKGNLIKGFAVLIGEVVLNATLTQTWYPYLTVNVSLNGVAWFLSTSMFLYFLFPWMKKWMETKKNNVLWIICVFILIVEILLCMPMIAFFGRDSLVYIWFMYCFPPFRIGDYLVGCCLSKWYLEKQEKKGSFVITTIIELISLTLTIVAFKWLATEPNNLFTEALHNWTTIFIPIAAVWVLLFVKRNGLITRLLTNKVTIFLGNISGYMFLIHFVLIQWIKTGLKYLNVELEGWSQYLLVFGELGLTIIISMSLYRRKKRMAVHEANHSNTVL